MSDPPAHGPPFAAYQAEIFLRGLGGTRARAPGLDRRARALVEERIDDPRATAYVFGGAGREHTMRANLEAFRRWRIVPRMLRDVSERDLSVTVLNTRMPAPVALAPVGVQSIIHPEAELAVARAAAAVGLTMTLSTVSSFALEEVAEAGRRPEVVPALLAAQPRARGEPDRPRRARRLRGDRAHRRHFPARLEAPRPPGSPGSRFFEGTGIANYTSDPVFRSMLEQAAGRGSRRPPWRSSSIQFSNPELNWDDLEFLRAETELPVLIKGILHPDDARAARDREIDGVVVSNHGGRQVDGEIAALDALPAVADAVGDDLAVLLDSGVRSGADVVKALALGADAVLLGRPYLWGLALGGEAGVVSVLRALLAELDLTVGLTGHTRIGQIGPELLAREGETPG